MNLRNKDELCQWTQWFPKFTSCSMMDSFSQILTISVSTVYTMNWSSSGIARSNIAWNHFEQECINCFASMTTKHAFIKIINSTSQASPQMQRQTSAFICLSLSYSVRWQCWIVSRYGIFGPRTPYLHTTGKKFIWVLCLWL